MYPTSFEYLRPKGIDDALELLRRYGDDAKLLAGGQSLVPMMKLRVARPKYLIDIHRIADLSYIREEDNELLVGATTRHVEIEESPLVGAKLPMLREAAGEIGDLQVRNRGTIGGGLVEADPCGDYGPVVLALNAQMKCIGPRGERVIPAAKFFTFAYTTALEPDEILTEIVFSLAAKDSAGVYVKLEKVAGDFAIASAAVQLRLDAGGSCREIGVGAAGGGAVPQKGSSVELLLRSKKITDALIQQAGNLIVEGAEPIEDMRGSASYKKKALSAILRRALTEALRRAEAARTA